MTKPFPVSGNIEPERFPHLLLDLHRDGATGSLKVTGVDHPKALYFRGGRVLFGSSNDPRDQLGSILIESGKITREQLDEVNAKVLPGNPLAKVLADSGFVNQRELGDAARVKVERILADVLSWDEGSFEFEDGVLPKGAVDLKLSTEKLLLAAVQRIPDRAFALRHLDLYTVLEPAPEGEAALSEIRAEVWPLLERLDGQRTLKDAIALTRLDEFEAAKTACALLFLGAIRKKPEVAPGEELDLAREAQSGLAEEESPLSMTPPPETPAFQEPEPVDDQPFVFPEPAPPLAPEPPSVFEAAPEPMPTFVLPAPSDSGRGSAPSADSGAPPPFVSPEPASFPTEQPPLPESGPVETQPTRVMPPSFDATQPPLPRVAFDTVPGDRRAYAPPPLIPAPPRNPPAAVVGASAQDSALPEIPIGSPSSSKPTRADLAAIDELLNPSGSGRTSRLGPGPREGWQPQFRPAATSAPRRTASRGAQSSPSRVPLVLVAVVVFALASAAAWYFLLRTPAARPSPAVTVAESAPPAGVTPTTEPMPSATPTAAGMPVDSGPAPEPATTPSATPPTPTAAAADPRVLLGQGALPEAARAFVSSLAPQARGRFSLQILTACAPDTVQKAVAAAGSNDLFILPVALNGRACFRVCWGVYDDRSQAEAALATLPTYFRQGGARPRVSVLTELLP